MDFGLDRHLHNRRSRVLAVQFLLDVGDGDLLHLFAIIVVVSRVHYACSGTNTSREREQKCESWLFLQAG
jgi:hypothetical protein